jgi:hypothetical protein
VSLFTKNWLPFGVPTVPILPDTSTGQFAASSLSYAQLNQAARQVVTLSVSATVTFLMDVAFSGPDGSGGTYSFSYASDVSVPWIWSVKLDPAGLCLGVADEGTLPFKQLDNGSFVTPPDKTGTITTTNTSAGGTTSGTSNVTLSTGPLEPAVKIARHPVAPWISFLASATINGLIGAPGYAFSSQLNLFTGTLAAWQALDTFPADTSVYHSVTGDAGTAIFGAPLSYQAYNYANTVNFSAPAGISGGEYLTITDVNVTLS